MRWIVFSWSMLLTAQVLGQSGAAPGPNPAEPAQQLQAGDFVVKVRFITAPQSLLDSLNLQVLAGLTPVGEAELEPLEPVELAPGDTGIRLAAAETVVRRHMPVLVHLLSSEDLQQLLLAAQGNQQSNIMSAPKITLPEGDTGTISDVVQRTFVTGWTPLTGAADTAGKQQYQPTVQAIDEGSKVKVRVTELEDAAVELETLMLFSSITDVTVESVTLAQDERRKVQVPEVTSTNLNLAIAMHEEQTLFVRWLQENPPDEPATKTFGAGVTSFFRRTTARLREDQGMGIIVQVRRQQP